MIDATKIEASMRSLDTYAGYLRRLAVIPKDDLLADFTNPTSDESKRKDARGNLGTKDTPVSVNSNPSSFVIAYNVQACVCMFDTGKSVHPNGLPPVVSPGCLLDAELSTSGPLHVPYQISG